MRADNIELRFNRTFQILMGGTLNNKLNIHNPDHLECIRKIHLAFNEIYSYDNCKGPGSMSKVGFFERFLQNPLLTNQMVGRVFSVVVPYKVNSGNTWKWRHPLDISTGCANLMKGIEEWNSPT